MATRTASFGNIEDALIYDDTETYSDGIALSALRARQLHIEQPASADFEVVRYQDFEARTLEDLVIGTDNNDIVYWDSTTQTWKTGQPIDAGIVNVGSETRITTAQTLTRDYYCWACNTDSTAYTVTLPLGQASTAFRIVNSGTSGNDLTIVPTSPNLLMGAGTGFILSDMAALILNYNATDGYI